MLINNSMPEVEQLASYDSQGRWRRRRRRRSRSRSRSRSRRRKLGWLWGWGGRRRSFSKGRRVVRKGEARRGGGKKRCCSCSPDRSGSGSGREGERAGSPRQRSGRGGRKGKSGVDQTKGVRGEDDAGSGRTSRRSTRTTYSRRSDSFDDDQDDDQDDYDKNYDDDNDDDDDEYAAEGSEMSSRYGGADGGRGDGRKVMKNGRRTSEKSVSFTSRSDYRVDGNGREGRRTDGREGRRTDGREGRLVGRPADQPAFREAAGCPRHGPGGGTVDQRLLLIERTFFDNVVIVKRTTRKRDGSTRIEMVTRRIRPGEERMIGDHTKKTTTLTRHEGDKLVREVTKSIPGPSNEKVGQKTTTVTTTTTRTIKKKNNGSVSQRGQEEDDEADDDEGGEEPNVDEDDGEDFGQSEGETEDTGDDDDDDDDDDEDDEDDGDDDDDDEEKTARGPGVQVSAQVNENSAVNFSLRNVPSVGSGEPWRQTYVCVPSSSDQLARRPNIIAVPPAAGRGPVRYAHQVASRQPHGVALYGLVPHRL